MKHTGDTVYIPYGARDNFYYAYEYKNYFYGKIFIHKIKSDLKPLQHSTRNYLTYTRRDADHGET